MERSRKFWNKRAHSFDKSDDPTKEVRQATYARIRSVLDPSFKILEFGCATGSLSLQFARDVQEIYGVDISDEMISIAKSKVKASNLSHVYFAQGTEHDIPWQDKLFEIILAFYVLHLVENPEACIKKLASRLDQSGTIIIELPCLADANWIKRKTIKLFTRIMGLPIIHSFKAEDIIQMFERVGLEITEKEIFHDKIPRLFLMAKKKS